MSKILDMPLYAKVTVKGREPKEELQLIERDIQEFVDTRCGDMDIEVHLEWDMKRAGNE